MSKSFNNLNDRQASGVKGSQLSKWDYKFAGHRRNFVNARTYKTELKNQGFRVKIRSHPSGGYDVFIKDIRRIDQENNDKHRRKGVRA